MVFGTLEAQVAADNAGRVRISKTGGKQLRHILYMAAQNAKKTTLLARHFTTGRGKREAQKRDHYCRLQRLLASVFAVVKSGVLYQDDYFKKLA
jgi:hypothetical protein